MSAHRLLLVEDDPDLLRVLTYLLSSLGYELEVASDGSNALERASTGAFELIILDVMLPGLDGLQVCAELRRRHIATPILMLTARSASSDKVAGFIHGADDYLTKPFDSEELRVRIEALLRRRAQAGPLPAATHAFGNTQAHLGRTELVRNGRTVTLTTRESRLLRFFIENRGRILSRDALLHYVWGYQSTPYTRTVDVHILRLRQKIEEDPRNPRLIITVPGLGYRFDG